MNQELEISTEIDRENNIRKLATFLHENFCEEKDEFYSDGCRWNEENWFSLEINHHRAEFYDKAEKIYNYFDSNILMAHKVIQFILASPVAKQFFETLI